MSSAPIYCTNHPKTETLLRCNKCGRPFCVKCLERTPVGYRCKECLNIQQAGYYTSTPVDYVIVAVVGTIASMIGGGIALLIGGFGLFAILLAIFYGPAAGGIIAEVIRWSIQRRRGKYLWLVACLTVVGGAFLVAGAVPLLVLLMSLVATNPGRGFNVAGVFGGFFNIGLWIYLVLAVSTVYARLRN
jgi:hypothetical protein